MGIMDYVTHTFIAIGSFVFYLITSECPSTKIYFLIYYIIGYLVYFYLNY